MTSLPRSEDFLDLAARTLPPPGLLGRAVRLCPAPLQSRLIAAALGHVLAEANRAGELDYLDGKSLSIEVVDLGLAWKLTRRDGRLVPASGPADTAIRGRAVEFLLLAGGLEDPDTLFFQRRLEVSGDTVVGLTTRNLLDRLALEDLPLALRIPLNRAARFARRVRDARAQPAIRPIPGPPVQ